MRSIEVLLAIDGADFAKELPEQVSDGVRSVINKCRELSCDAFVSVSFVSESVFAPMHMEPSAKAELPAAEEMKFGERFTVCALEQACHSLRDFYRFYYRPDLLPEKTLLFLIGADPTDADGSAVSKMQYLVDFQSREFGWDFFSFSFGMADLGEICGVSADKRHRAERSAVGVTRAFSEISEIISEFEK